MHNTGASRHLHFCAGRLRADEMVRQVKHSDESESDWDSLSESGAPGAHPPAPIAQHASPVLKISADQADDPLYSEIKRPQSDGSQRTAAPAVASARPASSGPRGPLTFVDRNLPDENVGDPVELNDVPAAFRDDVEELRMDEAVPVHPPQIPPFRQVKKKRVSISNESSSMRTSFDLQPSPHRQPPGGVHFGRRRSSSSSESNGFDNIAFEGDSQRGSPPLVRSHQVNQPSRMNQPNDRQIHGDQSHQWKAAARSFDDLVNGAQSEKVAAVTSPAPNLPRPDETIEIFHFDKANTEFLQVSEKRSRPVGDRIGDTLFQVSMRFWSEAMAVVGLPFVCLLALLLQLLRFVSVALLRPLIVGLLTGLSDGLLKPVLSVGFNSVVQPVATALHNVGSAVKLIVAPLAESVALLLAPIGHLLGSFRLVEIHRHPPAAV